MGNGNGYLEWAAAVAADPLSAVKKATESGRDVYAFMCSYVPEEIVYAAGILPVRILGRSTKIQLADKHLQTYCCSQVRSSAEDLLSGMYDSVKGILFSHTCDTMQCFYEIVKRNIPGKFLHMVNFPSRLDMKSAFDFTLEEIRHFKKTLEAHIGKTIDDAALKDAVAVYNTNRELLNKLYALHAAAPDDIPSVALLHSVMASFYTDKREVNERLSAFLSDFKPSGKVAKRAKILLVGNISMSNDLYNLIDEYGATVVDDDMCTGRRYFSTPVAEPTLESLTRRYFDKPHCAAKHKTNTSRLDYVMSLVNKHKADGVLFIYLKFCDPHSFDYPYIREGLDKANIPAQLIEIEQSTAPSEQLRTKIQAFAEMLSAR